MKKWLFWIGGLILLLILALVAYGALIEPYQIDIQEETAVIPGLPASWEGKRIAVVGDFQVGMWLGNTPTINDIAVRLAVLQPEVVLIVGDYIYHPVADSEREIPVVIEQLQPLLQSGIPVYSVLGNHDYAMNGEQDAVNEQIAQALKAALEQAGIVVLQNQALPLAPNGAAGQASEEALYLVGLGAHYPDLDLPQPAFAEVPAAAPRLVMMHHPDTFAKLPANSAPLAVAGHTHGGQIRIPFTPQWSWMTYAREDEVHADGWIDGYGAAGNRLYVNRGVGFSVVPIRINCPPELTLFTLQGR